MIAVLALVVVAGAVCVVALVLLNAAVGKPSKPNKPGKPDVTDQPGEAEDIPSGAGDLPGPSSNDRQCVTYMSSSEDTGDCFALAYNHCTSGYKDQGRIPGSIASKKSSILGQVYNAQKSNFDGKPADWTTVCVARPDKAGKGACGYVKPGEFRVWAAGKKKAGADPCAASGGLYVKAHFNEDGTIQAEHTGTVGHG